MSAYAFLAFILLTSARLAVGAEVYGVVVSRDGGDPVSGAGVRVPALRVGAITDTVGRFTVDGLPPGTHTLVAGALGFRPDTVTVAAPGHPVRIVLIANPLVLPSITVSGVRPAGPDRTSAFAEVIRTVDVPSPTADLPEMLDDVVGVRVRETGGHGSHSTLSIRGSSSEQVRVYLDGIPLNQALGGGVNLALIPASAVENVEVYRGVIPPQFGGSGAAGVVNMQTHPASDTARWRTSYSFGSWNTQTLSAWLSGSLGALGGMLAADYSYSDNDFEYLDDNGTSYNLDDDAWARRRNNQYRSATLFGRLSSPSGRVIRWDAGYSFVYADDHLPGNSTLHEIPSNTTLRTDQHLVQLRAAASPSPMFEGDVQGWWTFRRDRFDDREGVVGLGRQFNDDTTTSVGARLSLATLVVPWNRLGLNATVQQERVRPNDILIEDPSVRAAILVPSDRRQFAAYTSDELAFPSFGLTLDGQLGVHHTRSRVTHNTAQIGYDIVRDTTALTKWPRALGAVWRPSRRVEVRANWGCYVRIPNLYELFGDRGATIGNSDLRPETGTNRDVGVRLRGDVRRAGLRDAELEFVYFDNRLRDAIVFWEVYNRMRPFNLGGAHVRGVELSARSRLPGGFAASGNVTWQRPENTSTESQGIYRGDDLPHQPRIQADVRVERTSGRTTLFYASHAHNEFYAQPLNALADRYSAAWLHDLGLTLRIGSRMEMTVEGRNLTNVRQYHSRYVPLPGRSWFLTVQGHSG